MKKLAEPRSSSNVGIIETLASNRESKHALPGITCTRLFYIGLTPDEGKNIVF
jgi:hypothetical protein